MEYYPAIDSPASRMSETSVDQGLDYALRLQRHLATLLWDSIRGRNFNPVIGIPVIDPNAKYPEQRSSESATNSVKLRPYITFASIARSPSDTLKPSI